MNEATIVKSRAGAEKSKSQGSRKQYTEKEGLDKIDRAIGRVMDKDIALDELEGQMFGEKEEGVTNIDERDLRRIMHENIKNKCKRT